MRALNTLAPFMKNPILTLAAVLTLSLAALPRAEAVDQRANVQNLVANCDFVVDSCVYEQVWIPATEKFPKGRLVKSAVVTGVHKGDIAVGTKLEYTHYVEYPPQLFRGFRSVVEGELRTFFFSKFDGTLQHLGNSQYQRPGLNGSGLRAASCISAAYASSPYWVR